MADYTAFVEAGNGLVEFLREVLTPEPISKRELISLCSPHESENNQLTVYLYHVEQDLQHSGGGGGYVPVARNVERMASTRYTMSFLITAHSKAPVQLREADQYRLMGAVAQEIKDMPMLDKKYLSGSLLESGASLRLSMEKPNFDQLIKIWNNTQKPYKLSVVCKMEGVTIDSKRTRRISRVSDVSMTVEQKPRMEK